MRNFKELRVWQKGFEIAVRAYQLIKTFPDQEKFGLSQQITRAAVSIPSNIAEGSGRLSEKEYRRFLEIALGSSFELETQLMIAEVTGFGQTDARSSMLTEVILVQKMLTGLSNKLIP